MPIGCTADLGVVEHLLSCDIGGLPGSFSTRKHAPREALVSLAVALKDRQLSFQLTASALSHPSNKNHATIRRRKDPHLNISLTIACSPENIARFESQPRSCHSGHHRQTRYHSNRDQFTKLLQPTHPQQCYSGPTQWPE